MGDQVEVYTRRDELGVVMYHTVGRVVGDQVEVYTRRDELGVVM